MTTTSINTPTRACTGTHTATAGPADPVWCAAHHLLIAEALRRIPRHLSAATSSGDGTLTQGRGASAGVRTPSSAPASPSPAYDTADQLRGWAASWADTAAAVLDHPEWRDVDWRLANALAYLDEHLDQLLAGPLAVPFGRDVLTTDERVTRLAGLERPRWRQPTPCPRCDRRTLTREDGSEVVECAAPTCGGLWTWTDYQRIITRVAAKVRAS